MSATLFPTLPEIQSKAVAEQATGCYQSGPHVGRLYDSNGCGVHTIEALSRIRAGEAIEVPNAGAGSYRAVFELLGFRAAQVFESSSSAGDWTLIVEDRDHTFRAAWQTNRYPYHGFVYQVSDQVFGSCAEVEEFLSL